MKVRERLSHDQGGSPPVASHLGRRPPATVLHLFVFHYLIELLCNVFLRCPISVVRGGDLLSLFILSFASFLCGRFSKEGWCWGGPPAIAILYPAPGMTWLTPSHLTLRGHPTYIHGWLGCSHPTRHLGTASSSTRDDLVASSLLGTPWGSLTSTTDDLVASQAPWGRLTLCYG